MTMTNSPATPTATAAEIIAGHDLTGKEAIVTGGYGGIGYETSKALASAGAHVLIAGRDAGKGDEAVARLRAATGNETIAFQPLDLGSLTSVTGWARRHVATGAPVHILVNNAGIMAAPLHRTEDGFESHFGINHLGHVAFTLGLLPSLRMAGAARVVCLSSAAHRRSRIHYDDPNYLHRPYDPWQAYGQSKTANALFTVGFAAHHGGDGLTVNCVMPGGIHTGLMRHMSRAEMDRRGWLDADGNLRTDGWKTPEQGAATSIWAAVAPELTGINGRYLEDCAIAEPWPRGGPPPRGHYLPYALDPGSAERLWELSRTLLAQSGYPIISD
jgi:NAD(P)-dependent dehydrogenase (short-subunit alcohol dehydrogenase family)